MMQHRIGLVVVLGSLCGGAMARADEAPLIDTSLRLDLASVLEQPPAGEQSPAPVAKDAGESTGRPLGYGKAGSRWWTIGAAYANDFNNSNDFNVHLAYSTFLADDLEFAVEAAGWYFDQPGDNTEGLSGSMVFRWHFLHPEDYRWTVFADAGIGIMGSFDVVPEGGTGFNFLPRIGGGFTWALDEPVDGESRGARLMVGLRYHHISNGRIASDSHNPSRDALLGYVAIVIPF